MKRKRCDDNDTTDKPSAKRMKELEGSFHNFEISKPILKGLSSLGIVTPSEIQKKALPYVLNDLDVIIQSKNGSGKTIVFSIVALQKIDLSISQVQSIIIVPTREIAIQVHSVIENLSKYITDPCKVNSRYFIGGTKWDDDFKSLEKGTHVLICSVGRLKKLLEKGKIRTENLNLVVLDEADKLFSFQLKRQTEAVLKSLVRSDSTGENQKRRVQVLALSATFPRSQRRGVENYMVNPEFLSVVGVRNLEVDNVLEFYISLPQSVSGGNMSQQQQQQQHPIIHNYQTKKRKLLDVLNRLDPHIHQLIIFTSTTLSCENLSMCLQNNHFRSNHLTSRLSQEDRSRVIEKFRSNEIRILVTTQLLSRGVDFRRVNVVINFEIPEDSNEYIHIMGRAGRFGRVGLFLNFVVSEDEFRRLMYARRLCSEEKPIKNFPATLHPSLFVPQFTSKEDEEKLKEFVRARSERCKESSNGYNGFVLNRAKFLEFSHHHHHKKKKQQQFQQNESSVQIVPPPPENNSDGGDDDTGRKRRRRRRRKRKKKKNNTRRKRRKRKKRNPKIVSSVQEGENPNNINILPPPPTPPHQQQTQTQPITEKKEEEVVGSSLVHLIEDDNVVEEKGSTTSFKHLLTMNFGIFSTFMEDMK